MGLFEDSSKEIEQYTDCPVLCKISRKTEPLVSKVPCDEFTSMVQKNFDYEFIGETVFYPYELPSKIFNVDFNILAIVGASGSGKSTLLKEFKDYNFAKNSYDYNKAIVSNFSTPDEAARKLSAVGLNSMPTWCKPRSVLSVGEGFRADVALNLKSYTIFDEFTSTIDRNVAKSTCNGLKKYIANNNLSHMVFCSCHKDFIPYLCPDLVIDLDDEAIYDCRGVDLKKALLSKCTGQRTKTFGECLGTITI